MRNQLGRRTFLRGAGVAMGLPLLEAMPASAGETPRRMLAVCNNLGLLETGFFPKGAGREYAASPYLSLLQDTGPI